MKIKPGCGPDDPHMPFYRIGGNPWFDKGILSRIYFDNSPGLRGQAAWEKQTGRYFPPGYYDVSQKIWVTQYPGWTSEEYSSLMSGCVQRKTCAEYLPREKLFTIDGVEMSEGMLVMFISGKLPSREDWGTGKLFGRLMIAGKRFAAWDAGIKRYGKMNIPVQEYSDHAYPSSWICYALDEKKGLEIEGRNFICEQSKIIVNPALSLISINDFGSKETNDPEILSKNIQIPEINSCNI